jgi:hypothetical protein
MKINVIKRSGAKEPLTLEKWQAQVAKVCKGIADVSPSMKGDRFKSFKECHESEI